MFPLPGRGLPEHLTILLPTYDPVAERWTREVSAPAWWHIPSRPDLSLRRLHRPGSPTEPRGRPGARLDRQGDVTQDSGRPEADATRRPRGWARWIFRLLRRDHPAAPAIMPPAYAPPGAALPARNGPAGHGNSESAIVANSSQPACPENGPPFRERKTP